MSSHTVPTPAPDEADADRVDVIGYLRTEFDCPACGATVSLESDATGELAECDACPQLVHVREVR